MDRKIIFAIAAIILSVSSLLAQSSRSLENIGIAQVIVIEQANNSGDIWAGSVSQGIAFYDGTNHVWHYYSSANTSQFRSDSITSISIGLIGGVQHVFIGTADGLVYNHGGTWDTLPTASASHADRFITGVSLISSDTLWASTLNGLLAYDTTTLHIARTYTTTNSVIPFNHTIASERGGKNCTTFTVASPDSGVVYTTDGSSFTKIDTTTPHFKMIDNRVNTIYIDNNCSRRLIGTKGGLSICPTGIPCQNFTTANGLPQNDVTSIGQDCRGNIWIGMRDSGVIVYNNSTFVARITTANGLSSNKVSALSFDGSNCTGYVGMIDGNIAEVDTAAHVVKLIDGISDISISGLDVSVYPQPSAGLLTFTWGKELTAGQLCLTDLSGRTIIQSNISHTNTLSTDVSALPAGLYFYRISTDGQPLKTGKVEVMR